MTLSFWAENLQLIPMRILFLSPKDYARISLSTRYLIWTLWKVSPLSLGDRLGVFLPWVSRLHFDPRFKGEKNDLSIHLLIITCLSYLSVVRIKYHIREKSWFLKMLQSSQPCSIQTDYSITSKSYTTLNWLYMLLNKQALPQKERK